MADIHIQRSHTLGLPKARKLAQEWAAEAQSKFALACTLTEGDTEDTVAFTRSGLNGTLSVTADEITVDAKLGFVLAAFSKQIESQISESFDQMLEDEGGSAA